MVCIREIVVVLSAILILVTSFYFGKKREQNILSAQHQPQQMEQSSKMIAPPKKLSENVIVKVSDRAFIFHQDADCVEPLPPQHPLPDRGLMCAKAQKLNIKLYNACSRDSFNKEDAANYIGDIYALLLKYAPSGMWMSAALAQAYTEGGAGRAGIYTKTNNCFGITAGPRWNGSVYCGITDNYYPNYQTAIKSGAKGLLFRVYPTIEESVEDYVNLIKGDTYRGALETSSPREYLAYLLNRNYGEPGMLSTWCSLIYGDFLQLSRYDRRG